MVAAPASPNATALSRYPEIQPSVIERCQAGNPTAIQAFVQHHQRLVFAYLARLLGEDAVIEDLAQEVFVRAVRALPRFDVRGPARVSTWLLTIASRLVLDEKRRAPQTSMVVELAESPSLHSDSPEAIRQRKELGQALTEAVGSLSHEQREAFILAEIHGLSMEELADVTQVAVGTAKARLSRARERLREVLGPLWEEIQ
jgi:RNA polymerase sigma-70 factor (ECF subfamily)